MTPQIPKYIKSPWHQKRPLLILISLILVSCMIYHLPILVGSLSDRVYVMSQERQAALQQCREYVHRSGSEVMLEPCCPGVPCVYKKDVDLRIIVMVYNRGLSLQKILKSISRLKLDGDRASLDIWIDISKSDRGSKRVLQVARDFQWYGGPVNLHLQLEHAGIYGQWINSWRPKKNSQEIGLILEDDVDLSPYAYRWLKAAYAFYHHHKDIGGISIYEGEIVHMRDPSACDVAFLHQRIGTQGFSPHPEHWRGFQDWYHSMKNHPTFHPYVEEDPTVTDWYRKFERNKKNDTMWEMWYIYYANINNLWTLYSNIGAYMHARNGMQKKDVYLAFHRAEEGLHFKGLGKNSTNKLLQTWNDKFVRFPKDLSKFAYNSTLIK